MKFREKTVMVDAIQWFPGKKVTGVVEEKIRGRKTIGIILGKAANGHVGEMIVSSGDWIVTDVSGYVRYPYPDEMFKNKFEPVAGRKNTKKLA